MPKLLQLRPRSEIASSLPSGLNAPNRAGELIDALRRTASDVTSHTFACALVNVLRRFPFGLNTIEIGSSEASAAGSHFNASGCLPVTIHTLALLRSTTPVCFSPPPELTASCSSIVG